MIEKVIERTKKFKKDYPGIDVEKVIPMAMYLRAYTYYDMEIALESIGCSATRNTMESMIFEDKPNPDHVDLFMKHVPFKDGYLRGIIRYDPEHCSSIEKDISP